MADILPFKGIFFNQRLVDLDDVVTPPYDKISPAMQEEFDAASPYNVVRLTLGKEVPTDTDADNKYSRAADFFRTWLRDGVLVQDEREAIYAYTQRYRFAGQEIVRRGFTAAARAEPFETGAILPHERTFPKFVEDRLCLLRATHVNFGQIFVVYSDPQRRLSQLLEQFERSGDIFEDVVFAGVRHTLGRVTGRSAIREFLKEIAGKTCLIADGHHRYTTAVEYAREVRAALGTSGHLDSDYRMMTFFNIDDDTLTILPTHRVVRGLAHLRPVQIVDRLARFFEVRSFRDSESPIDRVQAALGAAEPGEAVFGLYAGEDTVSILRLKNRGVLPKAVAADLPDAIRDLDVTVLHHLVFEHCLGLPADSHHSKTIGFVSTIEEGLRLVDAGRYEAAFFLNPTSLEQVRAVTKSGELMPPKSTEFYPKLLTGLIMRRLDLPNHC